MQDKIPKLLFIVLLTIVVIKAQAEQLVKWDGLCIPKARISWMQPGGGPQQNGPIAESLNHLKPELGEFNEAGIIVSFSGKEMARQIPGYTGEYDYELTAGTIVHFNLGSVVIIKPIKNAVRPYAFDSIPNLTNLWHLTGKWTTSNIVRLTGTHYYKVIRHGNEPYGLSFDLVKINLSSKKKYNVKFYPISNWYIGSCGVHDPTQPGMGFKCDRPLMGKKYYIQYSVDGKNINYINNIDEFMKNHVRKWASCDKK